MKTIHSCILAIFFLSLSLNAVAEANYSGWPEVSGVQWELKGNKLHISWHADYDETDIHYIIEKSTDGKQFSREGLVLGGFPQNNRFEFAYRIAHESGTQYRITQVNNKGQSRQLDRKSY
jgi:hypothetical protein